MQEVHLKDYNLQTDLNINFLIYFPEDYTTDSTWPLMIFLHGRGEQGNDLEKVKIHGPTRRIKEGAEFPFILVAPQCPQDQWWSVADLDKMLDYLLKNLPIDQNRIYLTGLSMGGFGTWAWATDQPQRFAAIAPICGGGDSRLAWRLKELPVWVFHGAKDNTVPIGRSQEMVDALKKVGSDVRFTVYPEAGHDSWTETYANPELYDWFLSKHK
ncbi:MAG: prolyl oligopeptidase family serine peptidase [Calditrichaeota bacterium]|nr:prolyl oligopeptidase family serine peptidase [Calditrichota bacterium]